MIAASDLRVGNWVYDGKHTQFPMFIVGIGEDYVYLDFYGREGDIWESTPDDLQGIPITEDLLKRMGFTFSGYGLWNKTQQDRHISINISREFVAIEAYKDRLVDSRCTCHGVKCLHHLQNLFYEISRTELKIDL
jgi:hypothetical protein